MRWTRGSLAVVQKDEKRGESERCVWFESRARAWLGCVSHYGPFLLAKFKAWLRARDACLFGTVCGCAARLAVGCGWKWQGDRAVPISISIVCQSSFNGEALGTSHVSTRDQHVTAETWRRWPAFNGRHNTGAAQCLVAVDNTSDPPPRCSKFYLYVYLCFLSTRFLIFSLFVFFLISSPGNHFPFSTKNSFIPSILFRSFDFISPLSIWQPSCYVYQCSRFRFQLFPLTRCSAPICTLVLFSFFCLLFCCIFF